MVYFFALVAGGLFTLQSLLTRFLLRGNQDAWAFSFFFSLVGALVALPFVLQSPKVSADPRLWAVMGVVGVLIVVQNYLSFRASNYLEASMQGAITKLRLLWVLAIGVLFLQETLTFAKVMGTLLTVLAGLTVYAKASEKNSQLGVGLAVVATFLYAVVIGLYKVLFAGFNTASLTFFIFALPAFLNLISMPQAQQRIVTLARTQGKIVLGATFFGALANLAMNRALELGEVSRVLVIIEAFLLVVLVGEHLYLKERQDLWKKSLAVGLAILGAVLIHTAS